MTTPSKKAGKQTASKRASSIKQPSKQARTHAPCTNASITQARKQTHNSKKQVNYATNQAGRQQASRQASKPASKQVSK